MKRIQIIVLLALILILGGAFYWLTKDNEVSVVQEDKTTLSPTQVESIENIGQWEFLSVSDEELIDTIRRGFFGDDQLVRIYYGTLRLGIDMKDVKKGWLQASQDSIVCTLPPIKLLDHNFIDEAKTKSFFEEGKWTGMCGEMAGDQIAVPLLLGLGLDEFSMSATSILKTRSLIKKLDSKEMKELADKAVSDCETVDEVVSLVKEFTK